MKGIIYLPDNQLNVLADLSFDEYPEVKETDVMGVMKEDGNEVSRVTIIDDDYEKIEDFARWAMGNYSLPGLTLELHGCEDVDGTAISLVMLCLYKGAELQKPEGIKCYTSFSTFYPIVYLREEGKTEQEKAHWWNMVSELSDAKVVEKTSVEMIRLIEL